MTLAVRAGRAPDSPVGRWDARWRLAALLLLAAGAASVERPLPAAGFLLGVLILPGLARLPVRPFLSKLGLLGLSVLPFLIVLPLTTDNGLTLGIVVGLKSLAVGGVGLVLAGSAPLPDTFAAARRLRLPGVLVLVAQLAHRYTFVLAAEARRVRTSMRARGFVPRTDRRTVRTFGHAAGAVLVRGGERAERVAAAMRCRGFDGRMPDSRRYGTRIADVLGFAAVAGGTIAGVAWDRA